MKYEEITDKALDYMLPELETSQNPKLTEWEREVFIPSIARQWKQKRKLTDRQREIVGQIWDKV